MNYKKKQKNSDLFEFNKQGIIVDEKLYIGQGIIARMIFDFTKPSAIIKYLKETLKDIKKTSNKYLDDE